MMSSSIAVFKVTDPERLRQVFAIRRKVFVEEQHCPPELEYSQEEESHHFLALYNGSPAGAARWRRTENGFKLERFAVLKPFRGKGVGAELVRSVLADLPPEKDLVYLNAQLSAEHFYLYLGFEPQGEPFEEAGIMHRRMRLVSGI